jgi:hypothetical protein
VRRPDMLSPACVGKPVDSVGKRGVSSWCVTV